MLELCLLSDGYANNPLFDADLASPDSLLLNASQAGVTRFFVRDRSLLTSIATAAEIIPSHLEASKAPDWAAREVRLERLSKYTATTALKWPSDKNMSEIFYNLLADCVTSTLGSSDLRRELEGILREYEKTVERGHLKARSVFEDACWRILANRETPSAKSLAGLSLSQRELQYPGYAKVVRPMRLANEVYHLAYAIGASRSLELSNDEANAEGIEIGVASSTGVALPALVKPLEVQATTSEVADLLNGLIVSLPWKWQFGPNFGFIDEIANGVEVREARFEYLSQLERRVAGGPFEPAQKARDIFCRVLAERLQHQVKVGPYEVILDLIIEGLLTPVDIAAGWALRLVSSPLKKPLVERYIVGTLEQGFRDRAIEAQQFGTTERLARDVSY